MPLVQLLDKSDIDDQDLPAIEAGEQGYGRLLYTWQAITNSPGLFAAYLPFLRAVTGPGAADRRIKELSSVAVAVLNHCRYTTSHRFASARANGVSDEELIRVAAGDYDDFTEAEAIALELTRAMTRDVADTPRTVEETGIDADLLNRAKEAFSDRELVEIIMSISVWNALSRFHRVMAFDLDMPAPPDAVQSLL